MEILRLMGILLLIILITVIGIKYLNYSEIKALTGTTSINAISSKNIDINYPTGFNKNNSILISAGIILTNDSNGKGWNYYGLYTDSSDGLNNAFRRRVNLNNSGIRLYIANPSSEEVSIDYKLVLMKTN